MAKTPIFTGAGIAIVTPFHEDFSINYDKLGELIDRQIAAGTDAIIICGTTGEGSTLTPEEHAAAIKFAVDYTRGRIPVIAGTGSNDTVFAAELSAHAERVGADGLLLVTPYYNKCSQAGLVAHYSYVADRTKLPMILYNVPGRTGMGIKPETYYELSKIPNINATKEASGDISAMAKTIALCGDNLLLYSGNDDQITPLRSLGGKGVISVLSHVAPKAVHDIATLPLEEATKLQLEWLDLANDLFCDVNPIPVKAAMNMMGMEVGPTRLPLTPLNAANTAKLRATLHKHNLI
ncbi:MAG: 4-hydroxy-tetrahydrodipicolinate synthase [Oscillospiraceae bacterium]|jgi:4-hydroxy-tetrahydrodipicolinate synthase|nr:4-hydroxy-tetrahydrodipicolinate synthase [Oscillospiraceae bacterium]